MGLNSSLTRRVDGGDAHEQPSVSASYPLRSPLLSPQIAASAWSAAMWALLWSQVSLEPGLDQMMLVTWVAAEPEPLVVEEGNKGPNQRKAETLVWKVLSEKGRHKERHGAQSWNKMGRLGWKLWTRQRCKVPVCMRCCKWNLASAGRNISVPFATLYPLLPHRINCSLINI